MIEVEYTGFEAASEKLGWIQANLDSIKRYIAKRMAVFYRVDLGIDPEHLEFVEVALDEKVYGLSVEPKPEEVRIGDIESSALLLSTLNPPSTGMDAATGGSWEPERHAGVVEGNPWAPDMVPISPDPEEAVWLARNAHSEELEAIRARNAERLDDLGLEPMDAGERITVQRDVAYNTARAEFGLGEDRASPVWRPAMRELIENRLEGILDDVTEGMARSELDEGDLPEFKPRSPQWWEERAGFMDFLWGSETE